MNRIIGSLIAFSSMILACNLPSLLSPPSDSATSSPDQPTLPGVAAPTVIPDTPTSTPILPTSIPSKPIGLRQGLASLNSYRLEIRTINNGPTSQDQNEIAFLVESASDGESWHITNYTLSSSADDPEVSTDQSDQYKVGDVLCEVSGDDGEAEQTDVDPQAQEIQDVWSGLFDLVLLIDDPVIIGSETLNGVQTNHFQFRVSGLGVDSGAEVVASDGEYWLAVDGQYIVKYVARLETRNGPAEDASTHTMHSEFYIEVKDINQPIVITAPANCQ